MLLDIQQGYSHQDEDLITHSSQNAHQQALKALLAGNQQIFLSILTKNNMGGFKLPATRVLAESLNIKESQVRHKYSRLINQKFSQVLRASEIEGRFFVKPEQLSLHNYAKSQYFEDKNRLKADESIAQAYTDIFRRITNIDDFVYFIDFSVCSVVRQPFKLVEEKAIEFLNDEVEPKKDIQILKQLDNQGQQEQIIIEYCFCVVVLNASKKIESPHIDRIIEGIQNTLKNQPLKHLFNACLELSPTNIIDDILEKHPRELVEYDFKNNEVKLKSQYLHPQLCGFQTFKTYFKKMNNLEQLVEKFETIANSAKFQQGKLLLGINYDLLGDDEINSDAKYMYGKKVTTKSIAQFSDFLGLLSSHITDEFVVIGQQKLNEKFFNVKYACKCLKLFANLNKLKTIRQHQIYQNVLLTWGRLLVKWNDIEEIRQEQYFIQAISSYFSIIYSIDRQQSEFIPLHNFEGETSKVIFYLLCKIDKYPCDLHSFKGIKAVIFKWATQNLPTTPELKNIISKFINCFFDDKLTIKSSFKDDIFQTPALCKSVKKAISAEISQAIAAKTIKLTNEKVNTYWHRNAYQYSNFFIKLGSIISSRILQSPQLFSNQLIKLYENFAHIWPVLHSYRLWILQISKDTNDFKFDQKLQKVTQMWKHFYSKFLTQTKQNNTITWFSLSKQALQIYQQFYLTANTFISTLLLKKNKDSISKQTFNRYFQLLLDMTLKLQSLNNSQEKTQSLIKQWTILGYSVEKGLKSIQHQLLFNLRYWVCNSLRFLSITEEQSIMKCIGQLIIKASSNPTSYQPWALICDILGMNDNKKSSIISIRQIVGPLQRYTAKLSSKLQAFVPFNLISTLYASIRTNYKLILKYLFNSLLTKQSENIWQLIEKIVFCPVLISGSCIFNYQNHQKAKEDMALGLYYDQFEKITELITEEQDMTHNVKIIVMLEKKKIFSKFYQILRTKNVKIVEKMNRPNPPSELRYRNRNMSNDDVINTLGQMGVSREQAEIALQNIQYPDHNLAMEWIDNNQQRLYDMILNRTLERTRQEARREPRKQPEVPANQIVALTYQRFYDKEKIIKLSRNWIKVIFKQLFKEENMSQSQTLKDLLFLFMDSLKTEQIQSQYTNLNDKIFSQIDELNKQQEISHKLLLYLTILQGSFSKTQKTKNDFFQKSVSIKILSYLPRIQNAEIIQKVFSLINATLPVFTNKDVITPQLQSYLSFLLDAVLKYRSNKKSFSQIMLKIAKSGKQELMQRITRNVTVFFKQKLIKQNMFNLINILFQSDKQFSKVNAQLDLKTYLYERYKHRLSNFHPDKQNVLEIDIKQFQNSFTKYEKGSSIYEVSIGMLAKKKNRNRLLFYDCRKQKNAFDYSFYGKSSFLKYPIRQNFKNIIKSILRSLFEAKDSEVQQEILTDLYKLLNNYRILIPFTIQEQIFQKNLLEWLVFNNNSKRKFKFLTFLTLNVNFFIPIKGYQFSSLSDCIIAKIILTILKSSNDNLLWTSFTALQLSQVRRFSELTEAKISKQIEINMIDHYENLLSKVSPLQYVSISQFLYVQYKRRIVDNLRRKYKFATNQGEATFDRQFLNLSPFFNSVPIHKQKKSQIQIEVVENVQQFDEEQDQQSDLMILDEQQGHRFLRRRQNILSYEPQYEQLIVPLPQPVPKQNKDKEQEKVVEPQNQLQPIIIKNWQYLQDIINRFDKYLNFEEELRTESQLKEAILPQQNIIFANLSNGFKINIEQPHLDLDLKIKKLNGFQKRVIQIYEILAPKSSWDIKKKEANQSKTVEQRLAFMNLGRRLIQSLQSQGQSSLAHNRQALITLQRLMQGRHSREAQIQPARNININDIYQHLQEFTDAIVPVVQQAQQQINHSQVVQINEAPKEAEPMVIQQPVNNIQLDNNIPVINQFQNPVVQAPNHHLEAPDMPIDFQFQDIVPVVMQPQSAEQNLVINPQENLASNQSQVNSIPLAVLPSQNLVQAVNQQQGAQIQIQQSQNVQPNSEQPQVVQPPTRQRQILSMMGLSQTFLRDVGLDQEFFDSLPQDLQQEQLLQLMSQQRANINRNSNPNNNNPNQPNQHNEGPVDQASQNVAFLASLDMQTRAQVLLEATPEFLATLPPNIREEAQRYRHHQINRIIQEEQIEQEKNHAQKSKAPVVYPVVKKQEFTPISQQAARGIFLGIFNIYPKFKLSALKILLDNKQTQDKALSTIIALLKSLESNQKQVKIGKVTKVELQGKKHKITQRSKLSNEDIKQLRTYILHIILQHITIPLYKDQEFLLHKIGNQVYCEEIAHKNLEQIDPLIQLLDLALSYYPQLATELLKKTKDLPIKILQKLIEGIRRQAWPLQLYDSLQNFSENQQLKQMFGKQFDSKPPSTKILSKLLKYKFAQLISLKKIHQDALEYYTTNNIQLLNQIFCIYNIQNLHQVEPLLVKYKQTHFEVIKHLIQNGRQIEKQPIGILLKRPHLLDFETKKFIFRSHPRLRRTSGRRVHIQVDRTHLFQGSYNQLMSRSVRELQGKIQVTFVNQPGYDAGGLKRQWFLLVSRQIFNQNYALFEKSSSGSTYQPNPKSYINPDHLNYFKFIGRFIAKALVERELIDAYFTRAFYKTIIGQQLQFKDLEAQDYEFYKSMQWLKNNKIDQGIFTFSYIYDNFGNKIQKELVPGGKDIIVTQDNKKDYIEKYCMAKMRDDFSTQLNKFLEGFHQVVPQEWISYFDAKELELLISGIPEVDVEDMKRNTDYSGYNPTDQIIVWFWEIVSEYSQEDIAKLVQFITGTSRIPVEGFSHLIGMNGVQRISIHRDPCDHQLPKSHTCFNQLDLPNYSTKQILREKLAICLAWGSEGFGFM